MFACGGDMWQGHAHLGELARAARGLTRGPGPAWEL